MGKKRRRRLTVAAILSLPVLGLLSLGACDGLFYHPTATVYATAEDYGLSVEEVHFAAPDGPKLHGWWVPAIGPSKGAVVYCHGNDKNITWHTRFVRWLPRCGFHLLVFDYRGYGQSEGSPTRAGTIEDAVAAIDFAKARDPGRIVLFGHSLGGAIAVVAASRRPEVRGLVVESSFGSYRAAARCTAPLLSFLVPLLISDGLDPVDAVSDLPPRPLLVIHGTEDHITPIELGRDLFAKAAEPKSLRIVEGARHATPWLREGAVFERDLVRFFVSAIESR